ncbi:hypothetical protein KR51_00024410 [Rubidibacter lacunae KORDI 51-2]|uniref:Uncharacterized protein n=1 Tax=Rubidibacter lacunae KORDI 51-2 TaxID=582515 RepID=U5DHD3_9CHRO|nr:hypothetical protein [Rubidibacter lacunae]ERN41021.1 hypothetical protein KR51_00024410 [Rubidibacter lacunae KORDI 51-2]
MKSLLPIGLSAALSSVAIAPGVLAEPAARATADSAQSSYAVVSPSGLVSTAYRGGLRAEGIPGYARLDTAYSFGRIHAKDLVRAGIRAGLLAPETISDRHYIRAVEIALSDRND